MSNYISYIGAYIKLPIIKSEQYNSFIEKIDSEDYYEVGYSAKGFRYLISLYKNYFSISDLENIVEKEITIEEINKLTTKFIENTKQFIKNFKEEFGVDLSVKYGAIFYEA